VLTGGISLLILLVLLLAGAPLFVGCAVAVVFMVMIGGYDPQFLLPYSYERISSTVLLAFPLFTLAGGIMEVSAIGRYLVDFGATITSRVKGGMGAVTCITNGIFGACSSSASAAITCLGPILIPRLKSEGYPGGYAAALVTAASGLAMVIPPSGHLIIYGWITYTSVPALFLGGLPSGILAVLLFMFINRIMVRRFPIKEPLPLGGIKRMGKDIAKSGWKSLPALMFPAFILGGIYGGFVTPTQAGALAAIYATFVGFFIYRVMTLRGFADAMFDRGALLGVVLILVFCAMMLGRMFTLEGIPEALTIAFLNLTENKYIILLLLNSIFILLGMMMDDISAIIIGASLTFTLATQVLGVHPVQLGAIISINTAMGTMTPPVAGLLYLGMHVGKVTLPEIIKPALIFMIFGYMPIILLLTFWPPLSLWLPTAILGPKIMGF